MKIILLSISLIAAGFLTATAQNNISLQKYQEENAKYEYPDFEKSQLPTIKKTNSRQDWWEPDTVYAITPYGSEYEYSENHRFINKYNSHGLLKECIEQWCNIDPTHTDGSCVNRFLYLYTYTYDSNNNILTREEESWVNTSSISSWLYIYTYDSNNNVLTSLLNNSILKTYTYDSNNNMLTELEQKKENNSWVNSTLKTYTYDSNNNRLSEQPQLWKNNLWVESSVSHTYTYAYDSNNNVLTRLVDNYILYTYTYDSNNNRLTELLQLRRNNSWENYSQNLMTYDENGNGTSIESWRWRDESWQPNPNLNSYISLYYNNMQSNFQLSGCHKMTASYINVANLTAIAKPPATPGLNTVSIYPNPTTGELRIENGELRIQQVSFFDITGIHLFSTQQTTLDVSHLPAGIYFVQIKTEKGMVAKKIVKW